MKKIISLVLVLIILCTNVAYASNDLGKNNKDIGNDLRQDTIIQKFDLQVTEISNDEFSKIVLYQTEEHDKLEKVDLSKLDTKSKLEVFKHFGLASVVSNEEMAYVSEVVFAEDTYDSDLSFSKNSLVTTSTKSTPSYRFAYVPIQSVSEEEFEGRAFALEILDRSFNVAVGFISAYVWVPATILGINISNFVDVPNDKMNYLANEVHTRKCCLILHETHNLWLTYAYAEKATCQVTVTAALVDDNYDAYNDSKTDVFVPKYSPNYDDTEFLKRIAFNRYYTTEICYEEHVN